MTRTNPIKLSEKSYLNILLLKYLKQKWWVFVWRAEGQNSTFGILINIITKMKLSAPKPT